MIPGYTIVFRNRESIKGGVGVYICKSIKFKCRRDSENLQLDQEHFWLEIPGRNKHSKALIRIMYMSTHIVTSSDRLQRIETLFSQITVTWAGLLILTGDMNIDMLQPSDSLTRQYQTM